MPYMDFSKNNLTPSGANKHLAVQPGIPEKEGYVTETQFKDWLKTCLIVLGYLDNGEFYKEAVHTTVIPKDENCLYVDMTSPTNFALYVCKSNTYKPLTEESQIAAVVTSLQNGTLVPLKAKQDQNGNVIDTTYFKIADLYNGVDSQATDKAATANVAYELQQEINNLKARGRYLSTWNCVLGLPSTNPLESPYPYKSGDYYVVSTTVESALDNVPNYDPLADYNVGDFCKESGTLYLCNTPITGGEPFDPSHWDAKTDNYKPSGSSYTTGVASTVVESGEVKPNDYYEYDGTSWLFLHNTQKTVTFSQIAGAPTDNAALSLALAAKLDTSKVYDGLDKTVAGFALDAKQGKVLSDAINTNSGFDRSSVPTWTSGTAYAIGTVVKNPNDGKYYRNKDANPHSSWHSEYFDEVSDLANTSAINAINNIHLIKSGDVICGSTSSGGAYEGDVNLDRSYTIVIPVIKNTAVITNAIYAPFARPDRVIFWATQPNEKIYYEIYGC